MAQWKVNFGDLVFGEKIGKGNFGEVYKGEYLGTEVAIKKLFFVDDDFMQKYIEREMDTLTQLKHPNIVQLMGLCIETDDMYIITEFVTGGSLRSKLKDTATEMDWVLRVSILRDIALALAYLHNKGIIHRDLKSHNLLVGDGWKVKVCDFGLARSDHDEGGKKMQNPTIVGTNEWMAPEIAMGESYDKTVDVFSFAMVMYELITRDKPPARKLKDGYSFHESDFKPGIPKDTPPKLWELLCVCASTEASERPQFKDVVNDLKKIIEGLEAGASGGSAKSPETEKKKKKKKDGERKKKKKTTGDGEGKKKKDGERKKKKKTTDGEGKKKKKKKETEKK